MMFGFKKVDVDKITLAAIGYDIARRTLGAIRQEAAYEALVDEVKPLCRAFGKVQAVGTGKIEVDGKVDSRCITVYFTCGFKLEIPL